MRRRGAVNGGACKTHRPCLRPVDFLRDPALSDDHAPLVPVLRWVLNGYKARGKAAEDVCLLMPCAPLIEASGLTAACAHYVEAGRRSVVLAVVPFGYPIDRALAPDAEGILRPLFPRRR